MENKIVHPKLGEFIEKVLKSSTCESFKNVSRDTYGTCYLPKGKKGEEKALIHYERILEYYYRTRTEEEFLEKVNEWAKLYIRYKKEKNDI